MFNIDEPRVKWIFCISLVLIWSTTPIQGRIWPKNESWGTKLTTLKVEGRSWPFMESLGTKVTILPLWLPKLKTQLTTWVHPTSGRPRSLPLVLVYGQPPKLAPTDPRPLYSTLPVAHLHRPAAIQRRSRQFLSRAAQQLVRAARRSPRRELAFAPFAFERIVFLVSSGVIVPKASPHSPHALGCGEAWPRGHAPSHAPTVEHLLRTSGCANAFLHNLLLVPVLFWALQSFAQFMSGRLDLVHLHSVHQYNEADDICRLHCGMSS
jgi:hypothetical protein